MNTEMVLGVIGLALAIIELWVPKLSVSLEEWMSAIVAPSMTLATTLKNAPSIFANKLDKFVAKTFRGIIYAGLPAFLLSILFDFIGFQNELVLVSLYIVFVITLIPIALRIGYFLFGGYVAYPLYVLAFLARVPGWFIQLANRMGNGKGVSGIGLMLAFWGVLGPLL